MTATAISIAVLSVHSLERTHPMLGISIGIAVVIIVSQTLTRPASGSRLVGTIILLLTLSVAYRTIPFLVASGPIGMDPHWLAVQTQALLENGHTDVIDSLFYSNVASFIVLQAVIASTLGLEPGTVLIILAAISGISIPLFGGVLTRRLVRPQLTFIAVIIAVAILVVAKQTVRFSYGPIAQTHAIIIYFIVLFILIIYPQVLRSSSKMTLRLNILLIVSVVGLALTHKLMVFIAVIVLSGLAVWYRFWTPDFGGEAQLARQSLLSIVILLTVWTIMTDFAVRPIIQFAFGLDTAILTEFDPAAAAPASADIFSIIHRNINWLLLVPTAGVAWAWLTVIEWRPWERSRYRQDLIPVLLTASVAVVLLVIGIIFGFSVFNPNRAIAIGEPVWAVLIGVAFVNWLYHFDIDLLSSRISIGVVTVILLVIIVQVGALGSLPDHPETPRSYLSAGERAGVDFAITHSPEQETLYTDAYTVRAGISPENPPAGYWRRDSGQVQYYEPAVFDGQIDEEHDRIFLRTRLEIYGYLPWGGHWVLEWDYHEMLTGCYQQIYDNGDSLYYTGNRCSE